MWRPWWHNLDGKPLGCLEETGRAFPRPQLSTWAGLGLFSGWWTSLPLVHKRSILFIALSPQKHWDLELDLVALHVTRVGPHKLMKLGQIKGLVTHCVGGVNASTSYECSQFYLGTLEKWQVGKGLLCPNKIESSSLLNSLFRSLFFLFFKFFMFSIF